MVPDPPPACRRRIPLGSRQTSLPEQGDRHGKHASLSDLPVRYARPCQNEEILRSYQPVWTELDQLWQLRATDHQSPQLWKRQQEDAMRTTRGSSLNGSDLDGFIRMILSAIPSEIIQNIPADVVFEVDPGRDLTRIHLSRAS